MKDFDLLAILLKPEFGAMLLHGIELTLKIAAGSWLLAMSIAIVLLVVRLTANPVAERAVAAYVSYHRNVPTLVQMMLWYFGIASLLPAGAQAWLSEHSAESLFAIIALGLCQAAYFSEDLRSGLRSIPAGQAEIITAAGNFHAVRAPALAHAGRAAGHGAGQSGRRRWTGAVSAQACRGRSERIQDLSRGQIPPASRGRILFVRLPDRGRHPSLG